MKITKRVDGDITQITIYCKADEFIRVILVEDETLKEVSRAYHDPRYTTEEKERFKV